MRTEREEWLALAKEWDAAEYGGAGIHRTHRGYSGLCACISEDFSDGLITFAIVNIMYSKIDKIPGIVYKWPRNAKGAKARAAFCREQALERTT